MAITYAQIIDGKRITFNAFNSEVAEGLKHILGWRLCDEKTKRLIKNLYNRGFGVSDAISHLIMKS